MTETGNSTNSGLKLPRDGIVHYRDGDRPRTLKGRVVDVTADHVRLVQPAEGNLPEKEHLLPMKVVDRLEFPGVVR